MLHSTQLQDKLHQALIEATVKLEEQKYEQQAQEAKVATCMHSYYDRMKLSTCFHVRIYRPLKLMK